MADAPPQPDAELPTIFADGILNFANSNRVVKMYLVRFDPASDGSATSMQQIVAQLVMPIEGFVAAAAFLQTSLEKLVTDKIVTQDYIDHVRSLLPSK